MTEADDIISGIVTARDIQGERPIRLIEESRVARADIRVRDITTPQPQIPVPNMIGLEPATVGHVVATLRQLERQHVLVVEVDQADGRQCVRGLVSASRIRKQMHTVEGGDIGPAHSLADIVSGVR